MKKQFVFGLLFFAAVSSFAQQKYSISGTASASENGKKIFLELIEPTQTVTIDSAEIKNGKFELTGKFSDIDIALLKLGKESQAALPFILEVGKVTVDLNNENIALSKIGGTKSNLKLYSYNQDSQAISKKMNDFQQKNMQRFQDAQANNNQEEMNVLMAEYNAIQDEVSVLSKSFVLKNPDSFLSLLLVENLMQRQVITSTEAKDYLKPISQDILKTKKAKALLAAINSASSLEIGNKAPDFSGPSPTGKNISLKESLGKVTIIDFWASWCGPCRKENPSVVAMYNELHPQGLNIIGVSLDKDATKWNDAIAKDKLTWNQVSSLQFWQDPIAVLYNIKSIPSTWILDKNGIIVAKDLRGDELKAKIIELLKQ